MASRKQINAILPRLQHDDSNRDDSTAVTSGAQTILAESVVRKSDYRVNSLSSSAFAILIADAGGADGMTWDIDIDGNQGVAGGNPAYRSATFDPAVDEEQIILCWMHATSMIVSPPAFGQRSFGALFRDGVNPDVGLFSPGISSNIDNYLKLLSNWTVGGGTDNATCKSGAVEVSSPTHIDNRVIVTP